MIVSKPPVYVLGVSAYYHDSAACLLRDGRIVAAAQEERFTRKRHDASFPRRAVAACLAEAGIEAARVDHVVFYDKPVTKLARVLEMHLAAAPRGFATFLRSLPSWLKDKLWTAGAIGDALGAQREVLFTEHHQAHAASAFFPSPFERAAVLTLDGVGEWATATEGVGDGSRLEQHRELRFPHSLGLLYSAFTGWCGFKVNSGEQKLMGLAPYGKPRFRDAILRDLVDLKDDGSFRLDLDHFDFVDLRRMTTRRFDALLGDAPRDPESPLRAVDMDAAASVQAVTEEIVLRICRDLHRRTGLDDLCMAGGVALNCVANGRILRGDTGFRRLWVQPAAGDAGGAMGAAYAVWHTLLGNPRVVEGGRDALSGARLGPGFTSEQAGATLAELGAVAERHDEGDLVALVARRISEGAVVGWMQGRMEWGPRALGARSILADARSPETQRTLNLMVKRRESFRPFAPIVLAEEASDWFDLAAPSPYMLVTTQVAERQRLAPSPGDERLTGIARLTSRRSTIPAVTHVDGSARVQTVDRRDHPRLHALLTAFRERTGCAVLVNTSFNVRGEPIVCDVRDAYACFMQTSIDLLVVEDWVLERGKQPAYTGPRATFEKD